VWLLLVLLQDPQGQVQWQSASSAGIRWTSNGIDAAFASGGDLADSAAAGARASGSTGGSCLLQLHNGSARGALPSQGVKATTLLPYVQEVWARHGREPQSPGSVDCTIFFRDSRCVPAWARQHSANCGCCWSDSVHACQLSS
jgi:hypothetical protein